MLNLSFYRLRSRHHGHPQAHQWCLMGLALHARTMHSLRRYCLTRLRSCDHATRLLSRRDQRRWPLLRSRQYHALSDQPWLTHSYERCHSLWKTTAKSCRNAGSPRRVHRRWLERLLSGRNVKYAPVPSVRDRSGPH